MNTPLLSEKEIGRICIHALREDIGTRDITSHTVIPAGKKIKAVLLAKESIVVCGLSIARTVLRIKDKNISFVALVKEGTKVHSGTLLARMYGDARSILGAERVTLNLMSFLSGIASTTRQYVERIKPYPVKILDTRKTFPGLRSLEKYAVRIGGGDNHRSRLDEMIMVKDNHIKTIGGFKNLPAIDTTRT
ncbi:MAG: nicotinate-nucleotide diphosphorylase (carboxylating), partial [Candidatus Omnitrophica bacterium]|nr:nicotinate-nucleotide diphosphorylase (carboxylating) [Candidatus Omnitrophota bacterium]